MSRNYILDDQVAKQLISSKNHKTPNLRVNTTKVKR